MNMRGHHYGVDMLFEISQYFSLKLAAPIKRLVLVLGSIVAMIQTTIIRKGSGSSQRSEIPSPNTIGNVGTWWHAPNPARRAP